jgi:hypothetical protein
MWPRARGSAAVAGAADRASVAFERVVAMEVREATSTGGKTLAHGRDEPRADSVIHCYVLDV